MSKIPEERGGHVGSQGGGAAVGEDPAELRDLPSEGEEPAGQELAGAGETASGEKLDEEPFEDEAEAADEDSSGQVVYSTPEQQRELSGQVEQHIPSLRRYAPRPRAKPRYRG